MWIVGFNSHHPFVSLTDVLLLSLISTLHGCLAKSPNKAIKVSWSHGGFHLPYFILLHPPLCLLVSTGLVEDRRNYFLPIHL